MFERFKRSIQPLINIYHLIKAIGANIYYGFPSRKLKVIGITGTDGKTTTTHLIYHILVSAGKKASMVSSVYAKIAADEFSTGLHVTTPDALLVQKLLKQAVKNGDEYFVLETTSHALDQNRNWGITYEAGVVTNITHEHLDYHRTYERYAEQKAKLLHQSKKRLVNLDDKSFATIIKYISSAKLLTYAIKGNADYQIDLAKKLKKPLTQFNNYNYLAAYSVCRELGIDENIILDALKSFTLPKGRLETVYDKDFKVIIDFAHTPNSIEQLLSSLKKETKGRLIHVFGSAGLRDQTKRPLMGRASADHADIVVITEEDYRTEDVQQISQEIASGIVDKENRLRNKTLFIIPKRQEAINKAISLAKKGDLVVCTGKSHETSMNRNGVEEPWDEFDAVQKALQLRSKSS